MARFLILVVVGSLLAACGSVCDDANDRLVECGIDPVFDDDSDCDEKDECVAECVRASSCAHLKNPSYDNAYGACLSQC